MPEITARPEKRWMTAYTSTCLINERNLRAGFIAIANHASLRNRENAIDSVLIYDHDHFFQLLVGEKDRLQTLMANIERDVRHEDVIRLIDQPAAREHICDRTMAAFFVEDDAAVDERPYRFLQEVYHVRRRGDGQAEDIIDFARSAARVLGRFELPLAA